jgi:3-phosphoshikimate 1-carboxyvinyltransferase
MADAVRALGVSVNWEGSTIVVGEARKTDRATIQVGNSGITARFMIALCSALPGDWTIECSPRMKQRPNQAIFNCVSGHCHITHKSSANSLPASFSNQTQPPPILQIDGTSSSQFISALILVATLWQGVAVQVTGIGGGKQAS